MKTLQDNHEYLRKQLDDENAKVVEKNKENHSLVLELEVAKNKSEASESELAKVKEDSADLTRKLGEAAPKESDHEQELANSNQAGYDQCFEEKLSELRVLRQDAYQLGYDLGLTSARIPMENPLRVEVVAPPLPVDEEADEEMEGHAPGGVNAAVDQPLM